MDTRTQENRWWENYAVRYLMPSIAGVAIVNWLVPPSNTQLRDLLLPPCPSRPLTTPSLILLFLYGNLFCYVASYPVLSFHATRVLDRKFDWSNYFVTFLLAIAAYLSSIFIQPKSCRWAAFILVALFDAVQACRIFRSRAHKPFPFPHLCRPASGVYKFAYNLALRRAGSREGEKLELLQTPEWNSQFIETYRHLR